MSSTPRFFSSFITRSQNFEAIRQHAIAALNITPQAKGALIGGAASIGDEETLNTAFIRACAGSQ
jgi:hypothetical protein